MANAALGFGIALIVLGLVGYVGTGTTSVTALIPAFFGLVLLICGFLARNPARRKLAMHIAAAVGLIGFFGSARGLMHIGRVIGGEPVERPAAVISQSIMAILSLAFTWLCVRSFINARRKGFSE